MQCSRVFSTTSECDVRDPIYTCIFLCPLVIECEDQCKGSLQKFNVLSQCQSLTVGREHVVRRKEAKNGRGTGSIEQCCFQTFIALFFHLSALFICSPSMGAVHIPNLLLYSSALELYLILRWKTFLSPMSGCQRAGCSSSSRLPVTALCIAWIEAFYFSAEQCDERAWNCSLFSECADFLFYSICQSVALQDHQ